MSKFGSILRSLIVLVLVLGAGFLGMWILNSQDNKAGIRNSPTDNPQNSKITIDEFSGSGGKTPQETITLLIKALEKNDVTLAVKYFIPEARETESEDLARLQDANLLGDLIATLKTVGGGKNLDPANYSFEVYDETGAPAIEIKLTKNSGGFWKLHSL